MSHLIDTGFKETTINRSKELKKPELEGKNRRCEDIVKESKKRNGNIAVTQRKK